MFGFHIAMQVRSVILARRGQSVRSYQQAEGDPWVLFIVKIRAGIVARRCRSFRSYQQGEGDLCGPVSR